MGKIQDKMYNYKIWNAYTKTEYNKIWNTFFQWYF